MTPSTSATAIVIGSGFGGAVAACRLAQAGIATTVLERGRRYPAGSFPRDTTRLDGWLWDHDGGLFDVRPVSDVLVVQAAGYGGGSLVYANVHYRPPDDVFAPPWLRDAGFTREALDPYYDLAAYMLQVAPIDESQPLGVPPKTLLMERSAERLGRRAQMFRPNLAVTFGPVDAPRPNPFGRLQSGCIHSGECDIGCNVQAKNTLDLNYLALAESAGATVRCGTEARLIQRSAEGYLVRVVDQTGEATLGADHVFVCAGAVGSTELLLRSREHLHPLSEQLGRRYSGNGDLLGFAFGTAADQPFEPGRGPTITTATVYDDASSSHRTWFAFEEGGHPRQLAEVLDLLGPGNRLQQDLQILGDEVVELVTHQQRATADALRRETDHNAVFLAMGRDHADGTIDLIPGTDRAHVHWNVGPDLGLYATETALGHDYAATLGARWVDNPSWRLLRQPVSVHNLGGCPMGASIADGVVGPDGGVFGNPGLHVLDGAIIPTAVGANPTATILAVAELCMERTIRQITGDEAWRAPERALATRPQLPEDDVVIPAGGTTPPRASALGLAFTETMRGTLAAPVTAHPAAAAGGAARRTASFRLRISTPNLDDFLADPLHPASADGRVHVEGLTEDDGAPVIGGSFHLFTAADSAHRRQMLYRLPFLDATGRRLVLSGHKDVWDHGSLDVWSSTTTLYATVREAEGPDGPVLAEGILRLTPAMFARQLTTLRATGTDGVVAKVRGLGRFAGFFTTTLADVFVRGRSAR